MALHSDRQVLVGDLAPADHVGGPGEIETCLLYTSQVRMVCHTKQAAEVYRQTWNLWYAEDKSQRL